MKRLLLVACAALAVGACSARDEDVETVAAVAEGLPATPYIQAAASGDMFEIQSGQLALQRSCDPNVRAFAQMIVNDHTQLSDAMMDTARAHGLTPPPLQMAPHHVQMLQRLQGASQASFDATFKADQIAAHQEALTLHRSYSQAGDTPPLRAVAATAVPAIEAHLGHAQTLTATPSCAPATADPRLGERG